MSNRLATFLLGVLALASGAAAAAGKKNTSAGDLGALDRAVLSASLQDTCESLTEHNRGSFEVLESRTTQIRKLSAAELGPEYAEALRNMLERNFAPQPLPSGIACGSIKVVDPDAIEAAFDSRKNAWDGFYAQFPGSAGKGAISLPGFSRHRDYAVVYRTTACGALCGSGTLQLLRKVGQDWLLEDTVTIWVS